MLTTKTSHSRKKCHIQNKLRRFGIKLNRWWIYYWYTGNPEDDPTLLTSRPRNTPLISLRNDEYCRYISQNVFVQVRGNNFWKSPSNFNIDGVRNPLQQINVGVPILSPKRHSKRKQNLHIIRNPEIYQDEDKENIAVKCILIPEEPTERYKEEINIVDTEETNSLDSFERILRGSIDSTYGKLFSLHFCKPIVGKERKKPFCEESYTSEKRVQSNLLPLIISEPSDGVNDPTSGKTIDNMILQKWDRHIIQQTEAVVFGFDEDQIDMQGGLKIQKSSDLVANNNPKLEEGGDLGNLLPLEVNSILSEDEIALIPLIQKAEFFTKDTTLRDNHTQPLLTVRCSFESCDEIKEYQAKHGVGKYIVETTNSIPMKKRADKSFYRNAIFKIPYSKSKESDEITLGFQLLGKIRHCFHQILGGRGTVKVTKIEQHNEEQKIKNGHVSHLHQWESCHDVGAHKYNDSESSVFGAGAGAGTVAGAKGENMVTNKSPDPGLIYKTESLFFGDYNINFFCKENGDSLTQRFACIQNITSQK